MWIWVTPQRGGMTNTFSATWGLGLVGSPGRGSGLHRSSSEARMGNKVPHGPPGLKSSESLLVSCSEPQGQGSEPGSGGDVGLGAIAFTCFLGSKH